MPFASVHTRRTSLAATAALAIALAAPARAAAAPGERIADLVAGTTLLFALRGNTVVTFDAAGREIARCRRFQTPPSDPGRQLSARSGPFDAQEALRQAGLPDDDLKTSEAEDVLAAEGLAPRRQRRVAPDAPIIVHALAASAAADEVWIATSAGLYRGRRSGCARVALAGRDVVAVAAAGAAVAAATADLLWRSADGGDSFRVAAGLAARPRALAVVDGARTLVADDDAVVEIGLDGVARTILARGGAVLAGCDGDALALVGGGVWAWRMDAPAERVGARPPARTLACGDGRAARFVAVGESLYASADGAVWRERPALPGRTFAAAMIGNRIYLATDEGVMLLDERSQVPLEDRGARHLPSALPPPTALPPLPTARLLEPVFPWPQVALVFTAERTALREGWSLVALVVFRLERTAAAHGDGRRVAAELVRRDAALAAQEMELLAAPPEDDDPSRNARLRALRQEREALR
jgi:hypothetical protein